MNQDAKKLYIDEDLRKFIRSDSVYVENGHKAVRLVTNTALIDLNIVPAVMWLNQFERVHTLYSCEGGLRTGEKLDDRRSALITFVVLDDELQPILCEWLKKFGTVEKGFIGGCTSDNIFRLKLFSKEDVDRLAHSWWPNATE